MVWQQHQSSSTETTKCFLSSGFDQVIRVWKYDNLQQIYYLFYTLPKVQQSFIRDLICRDHLLASCSDDRTVVIWKLDNSLRFIKHAQLSFEHNIYRICWSLMGTVLAVSQDQNGVSLFREADNGEWKQIQVTSLN